MDVLPDDQLAAIAIATKDGVNPVVTRIANLALRSMLGTKTPVPAAVMLKAPVESLGKPAPLPAEWRPDIGEYGWDFNTLYIHERAGKLVALIEWFFFDTLEPERVSRLRQGTM